MHGSPSTPDLVRVGLGIAIALAPILVMAAASQLLEAGVLAQPGGAFMVSITPYILGSVLLLPLGLVIVGLALPTDGSPRPVVVGAIVAAGLPLLLVVWFVVATAFSGAAGHPF